MDSEQRLPKRVVAYIHDMGVRALDHLADGFEVPAAPPEGEAQTAPGAVQTLVGHWKTMSKDDKQQFVDRVTASVVEVVAASAALPTGLKLGKKTAKATGKVIRKRAKTIKKDAKKTVVVAAPSKARAKAKPKPKSKPKAKK